LQNPGVTTWCGEFCRADFSETRFSLPNVSGSTIDEYVEVTRRFDQSPIDAIENQHLLSNVKEGRCCVRQLS